MEALCAVAITGGNISPLFARRVMKEVLLNTFRKAVSPKKFDAYHCRLARHRVNRVAVELSCRSTALSGVMMTAILKLDKEYRLTRAALVNAGVDMTGSMDALYRDWRRWRDKSKSQSAVDSAVVTNADQWWADHLAQFRCLIDPLHVAARAERARKDRIAVRTRPHPA
jgi:hypothetical protein